MLIRFSAARRTTALPHLHRPQPTPHGLTSTGVTAVITRSRPVQIWIGSYRILTSHRTGWKLIIVRWAPTAILLISPAGPWSRARNWAVMTVDSISLTSLTRRPIMICWLGLAAFGAGDQVPVPALTRR